MPAPPVPDSRAASMNSACLSESTWPRTIRAMVSHCTSPRATNNIRMLCEKNTSRMMTRNK